METESTSDKELGVVVPAGPQGPDGVRDPRDFPSDKELIISMQQGWDLMFSQARIISMLPLEDWLAAMSSADTLGPILDPTLWIAGHNKMGIIREMIEACLVVKRKLLELQQKVGKPDGL